MSPSSNEGLGLPKSPAWAGKSAVTSSAAEKQAERYRACGIGGRHSLREPVVPGTASALAALAARRCRTGLDPVGRIGMPFHADHRQNEDAAAIIIPAGRSGAGGASVHRNCDYCSHLPLPRQRTAGRLIIRLTVHKVNAPLTGPG